MSPSRTVHLPEDVLIPIFKYDWEESCFCRCPQPDIASIREDHACHWTRLMLVCREWRALAVSTPGLWRVIHVDKSLKWLQLSLPRTRTMALDLIFRNTMLALGAIPILCAVSHRIRKLALPEMTGGSFVNVRRTIFMEKLAALEELDLSISSAIGMMIRQAPLGFTPDRFPRLHTFRLSCFLIDFQPAAYKKLRRLDLRGCTVSAMFGGMYSYEQLIDMLAGCEGLEELQLQQSISAIVLINLPHEREHRVIRLSKMRKFVIWDKTPVVSRFLSYIDLPMESSVRIVGTYDSRTDIRTAVDAFVSLLPKDRSGFPILRAVTSADLAFFQTHAKLRAWRGDTKVTLKLRSSTDRKWEFYFHRGLREFRDIFAGAPLAELKMATSVPFRTVRRLGRTLSRHIPLFGGFTSLGTEAQSSCSVPSEKALQRRMTLSLAVGRWYHLVYATSNCSICPGTRVTWRHWWRVSGGGRLWAG